MQLFLIVNGPSRSVAGAKNFEFWSWSEKFWMLAAGARNMSFGS